MSTIKLEVLSIGQHRFMQSHFPLVNFIPSIAVFEQFIYYKTKMQTLPATLYITTKAQTSYFCSLKVQQYLLYVNNLSALVSTIRFFSIRSHEVEPNVRG